MDKEPVGVIVARFQSPELHAGHRYLIDEVRRRHADVLVVLGCTRSRPTAKDPLSYDIRAAMVKAYAPEIRVRALNDCRHDDRWCQNLDELIANEYPERQFVLYGSRESFLRQYCGANMTCEIPAVNSDSATEVRQACNNRNHFSTEFRAGLIAAQDRPANLYSTIDVAILKPEKRLVLLGGRRDENKLRFIGGFVDATDRSLEAAVKREVSEEAGDIEIGDIRYLGSLLVDDWRYRKTEDRIMTCFFVTTYVFGHAMAGDDIARIAWVPYEEILESVVDEHRPLAEKLVAHLNAN